MQDQSTDEEWRPIPGWEGWYEVSDLGRVRRSRPWTRQPTRPYGIKALILNDRGYLQMQMSRGSRRTTRKVHQLVTEAFHGPRPPRCEVNHCDGNKLNNRADNLEWGSKSNNLRHAFRLGLHRPTPPRLRGEAAGRTMLKESQVLEIMALQGQVSRRKTAKLFGVHGSTIACIWTGRTWSHLRQ